MLFISQSVIAITPSVKEPGTFNLVECENFLRNESPAKNTLKAIMEALKVSSCKEFKPENNVVELSQGLDLSGKHLTDLLPLQLFDIGGLLNLSNNNLHDLSPLTGNWLHAYSIDLSNNHLEDAAWLAKNLRKALVLDGNQISNPNDLGDLPKYGYFSFRNNRSKKGEAYDKALEQVMTFYSSFPNYLEDEKDKKFDFFQKFFSNKIDVYISMKSPKLEDVTADAEKYYSNAKSITYKPYLSTFNVTKEGEITVADFTLRYHWYQVGKGYEDKYGNLTVFKNVESKIEIRFDKNFKIISYLEKEFLRPLYRVERPAEAVTDLDQVISCLKNNCRKIEKNSILIPKGIELKDDFLRATKATGRMNMDTELMFRRVLYEGKHLWVRAESIDTGEYLVEIKSKK